MTAYDSAQRTQNDLTVSNTVNFRWPPEEEFHDAGYRQISSTCTSNGRCFEALSPRSEGRRASFVHEMYQLHEGSFRGNASDDYGSSLPQMPSFVYQWRQPEQSIPRATQLWTPNPSEDWSCNPRQLPQIQSQLDDAPPIKGPPAGPNFDDPSFRHDFQASPIAQPYGLRSPSELKFNDAAHQPVPLERRSTYSELSINLEFLAKLKEEDAMERRKSLSSSTPSSTNVATNAPFAPAPKKKRRRNGQTRSPSSEHYVPRRSDHLSALATFLGGTNISDDESAPTNTGIPDLWIPTQLTFVDSAHGSTGGASKRRSSASSSSAPVQVQLQDAETGIRNHKEPKKPSLACIFCRERKIACGRPPEGSADSTCNQCARRSFRCVYSYDKLRPPAAKQPRRKSTR